MKTLLYLILVLIIYSACKDPVKPESEHQCYKRDPNYIYDSTSVEDYNKIASRTKTQIITPADAKIFTQSFLSASKLNIPISWRFKVDELKVVLSQTTAKYVSVYCAKDPAKDDLTLIFAGTTDTDDDLVGAITHGGSSIIPIYDFADPCPSKCSKQNDVLRHAPLSAEPIPFIRK